MVISKTEVARPIKEIRIKKPTIGSDEGEQIASDSHLKRKRTSNDATGSVPQPSKNLHVDGPGPKVKIKAEENLNPEGSCLGKKSSVWDQEFKFWSWGIDQLCGGAEEYLRRAVGMMCLANLKAKENANAESKREKKVHDLQQEVDNLQADASKKEKQLRDLQQKVDQWQADATEVNRLRADANKKQLRDLQQKVDQLQADAVEVNRLRADASKREKQLRDLQQKADQLQGDAAEVNRLRSEVAKLSNENSTFYFKFLHMRREKKLKEDELFELKRKAEFTKSIQDLNVKEAEWKDTEESLKNQIAMSFESGFVLALEQVAVLHPTIDLSEPDLCKVVVDGKLVKEEQDLCKVVVHGKLVKEEQDLCKVVVHGKLVKEEA